MKATAKVILTLVERLERQAVQIHQQRADIQEQREKQELQLPAPIHRLLQNCSDYCKHPSPKAEVDLSATTGNIAAQLLNGDLETALSNWIALQVSGYTGVEVASSVSNALLHLVELSPPREPKEEEV